MAIVKATVRVEGPRGFIEGVALVDTGASLTLLDKGIADRVGARPIGRRVRMVVADGHEVIGELAILRKLVVEGEELPGAHVALIDFPEELVRRLRSLGLCGWCVIGLSTLELLGLAPNTAVGRVERIGAFFI